MQTKKGERMERDTELPSDKVKVAKLSSTALVSSGNALLYHVEFADWEPDHTHWRGPTFLNVYSDGSIVGVAKYLANMERTNPISDSGLSRFFDFRFRFLDSADQPITPQIEFSLGCLSYKEERSDVARSVTWSHLSADIVRSTYIYGWRQITPATRGCDGSGGTGVVIPFPPIDF